MFNDAIGFDKIYIACGYTDLHCGIDGLARIVQNEFKLNPFQNTLFLFCGRKTNRIKPSCGKEMDLFFYINIWKADGFNGRVVKRNHDASHLTNSDGLQRDYPLISQKQ